MTSETTETLFARYGPRYRVLVTVTAMVGTISAVITTTTVNVALPDIMGTFGIGLDKAQWLSTGALAAMTVGMLLNAWMLRSFGQRKTFVGALFVFVGALIVAGLSPNESVLIFSRVVQGAVAGILQPLSMYTLFQVYPPNERGKAMGYFGMSVILGPALGPSLGGVLIEHFNWRYVFFLAAPIASVAILLGSLFMPEREETGSGPAFDWAGFALLCTALATLLVGLSNGQREGWQSEFVVLLLAVAALATLLFVAWELRVDQPLVDLRVLANSQFAAASTVACIFGAGMFGTVYLVPLFVQTIQGFTPLAAGLMLMPAGLVLGMFMPFAGHLCDRYPARWLIVIGLLCFAVTSWLMSSLDANTSFWSIAWLVVISRIGLALIKPSLNVAALRPLRPEQLGQGAGLINFFRQLGAAFGVNLLSITLDRRTFFHSNAIANMQTAANSATTELLRGVQALLAQAGVPKDAQMPGALHYLDRVLYAQAYAMGFRDAFLIVAVVFIMALIPAWLMSKTRPGAVSP